MGKKCTLVQKVFLAPKDRYTESQSTYYDLHDEILLLSYFNSVTGKLKFGLLYLYNEAQSTGSSY